MRPIEELLVVEGWLVALSELHIGGLEASPGADLTLAVDGMGRHYLPGTGLAGALRAWTEAALDDGNAYLELWGSAEGASVLTIGDGLVFPSLADGLTAVKDGATKLFAMAPSTASCVEVRTGVGLDRATGTAAPEQLYMRQLLRRGVAIHLRIEARARDRDEASAVRAVIRTMLAGLVNGQVRLGAGRSRGLGRVHLDASSTSVSATAMGTPRGVLSRMGSPSATALVSFEWGVEPLAWTRPVTVTVPWEALSPLMVKDAVEGLTIDSLPLTVYAEPAAEPLAQRRPVLPGSSFKGALRQHAERIVRTMLGRDVPVPPEDGKDLDRFLHTLDELPLVTALFGRGGTPADKGDPRSHHGLGALRVDDVTGNAPLSSEDWEELVFGNMTGETDTVRTLSPELRHRLGPLRLRTHVAIDRWTGGAAEGALFTILEPWDVSWEPLTLELFLPQARFSEPERIAMLTLVLFLLRDLCAGMIPVGFGVNRGMGSVEADPARVELSSLPVVRSDGVDYRAPERTTLADLLSDQDAWTKALIKVWRGDWNPVNPVPGATS